MTRLIAMTREPSSPSVASAWSATPAPTSTRPATGSVARMTSPVSPGRCALLPAVVVDATSVRAGIDAADLPAEGLAGTAVLLHTGWDRHWRTDHYGDSNHPFLTAAGSAALVQADVALVGIDSVNIDSTTAAPAGAHAAPRRWHPDRRTPHRIRGTTRAQRNLFRSPGTNPGPVHLSRARIRSAALA